MLREYCACSCMTHAVFEVVLEDMFTLRNLELKYSESVDMLSYLLIAAFVVKV